VRCPDLLFIVVVCCVDDNSVEQEVRQLLFSVWNSCLWPICHSCSEEDETSDSPRLRQHPRGIPEEPGPHAPTWLSKFFSRITATHSVLKIWRKAKAIAVEKPGKDLSLAANYRPISLLSVCYKLLERLVLQRISPTVVCLLNPDQAGFQKGWSTCDQVAAPTTFIENGFQQNQKTGAVFLDLMAAYDTVWHSGLLYKLSKSMPYWLWRFAMQQSTAPQSGHALLTQVRSMCSWTLPCVSSLVPSVEVRSTFLPWLPVLSNIELPPLRRKAATDKQVEKIIKHDSWPIQPDIVTKMHPYP